MFKENIPLKPYNTFGVEANARFFAEVGSMEELLFLLRKSKTQAELRELPLLVLGGGSNLLFVQNFDGIVIKLNLKGITEKTVGENEVIVTVMAGENWHEFVCHTLGKNYGGLENLSLIPGYVGTSPIQNIGAYGVEIKDVFHSCKVLNINSLEIEFLEAKDCCFGYRDSVFKGKGKGKYIILEVSFKLTIKSHNIRIGYGAIREKLAEMGVEEVTIQDVSEAVVRIRQSKLPNPKILGNAGSFFKNPVISTDFYKKLKDDHIGIPGYEDGEMTKIPAGWLIEQCGWKGRQIGNVATHDKQSLVIVNKTNEATGQEIYDFSEQIILSVKSAFGIELEREVNVI